MTNEIRHPFGDSNGWRVQVAARYVGEDRGVDDAQIRYASNSSLAVDHRQRVRCWTHLATTGGVKRRANFGADHLHERGSISELDIITIRTREKIGERPDARQLLDEFDAVGQCLQIERVGKIAVIYLKRGVRVSGGQSDTAT